MPRRRGTPPAGAPPHAWLLNAGVVLADLLIVALAVFVTRQSLAAHRASAEVDARNLARLLETSLSATFQRIDLALRAAVDEHWRLSLAGPVDAVAMDAFLARQRAKTPELIALRITGPDGVTRYNSPPASAPASLADRDYFLALRDGPSADVVVSHPHQGRIIHTPVMMLARRVTGPGGEFGGVAFGAVELARLEEILSEVEVGPHGLLSLRHEDHSLVAQKSPPSEELRYGDRTVTREVEELVAAGAREATYEAQAGRGGARLLAFRRIQGYPLYVVVGLASADYLGEWRQQTAVVWLLVAAFVALSVGGAWYGAGAWRRRLAFERLLVQGTERLAESEERFRTAFLTSPDSINLNRLADGVYVAVNEGFTRMTGWTEADVIGRSSVALGIWADPADRARLVRALEGDGYIENLEARFHRKDGSTLVGLMSARRIVLQGEQLLLSITRDVTAWKDAEAERDRLQVQFQQAQRLEGLGRLAGGVAHDFNNLLTVILGTIEALRERLDEDDGEAAEDLEQVATAAGRARELTRQLLAFARKQVILPVPLDLAGVVRDSERLLRRVLGEDIAVTVELEEPLWPVLCDRAQLEQVILNLAVNARDAMPEGGTLAISARNASDPAEGARRPAEWVRLSVRDSGTGMTAETQEHLFEPFYTTKAAGKGTGLGLAMVHGIVAQSGGHIEVESAVGRGTTLSLYLPRAVGIPAAAAAAPAAPASAAPVRATSSARETVLVVEDDPLVRKVTVRALRGAGYEVLVAEGGERAIALAASHPGRLDLVVTDVIMPGLSGPQVVERLRRGRPSLPALFVSGYPQDAIAPRGVLDAGVEFLPKPFTAVTLLERVRTVLGAAVTAG